MISFCTNVSLFNWLTTLRGFLSPYPSKIFMSHKGYGETDFLMSGQLFILTYSLKLLTYSIIHSLNHTFTRTLINSLIHSFKLMMMKMMILMMMMMMMMSMISLIGMMMSMSMMSGVRQLKCVNLSVYNNLSICVCMEVCRMYRILIKSSSDLE